MPTGMIAPAQESAAPVPSDSPEEWLQQALTLAEKTAKDGGVPTTAAMLRRRIAAGLAGSKARISWRDAVSIAMDVLPPTTRAPWPAVTVPRVELPRDHALHLDMQTEWYFFDANGFTKTGDRFYMNFLFQVLGGAYAGAPSAGSSPAVRALSVICAATLVPADGGNAQRFQSWHAYPFAYSRAAAEAVAAAQVGKGPVFYNDSPQRLCLRALNGDGSAPVLELSSAGGKGDGRTVDTFSAEWLQGAPAGFSFQVSQDTAAQPVLMQGQPDKSDPGYPGQSSFTGLDPPGSSVLAQLTGTSYLYYSWSAMNFAEGAALVLGGVRHEIDCSRSILWMDHQGGVSKGSARQASPRSNTRP